MLSSLIKKTVIKGDNSFTIPEKDKAIANAKKYSKIYIFNLTIRQQCYKTYNSGPMKKATKNHQHCKQNLLAF